MQSRIFNYVSLQQPTKHKWQHSILSSGRIYLLRDSSAANLYLISSFLFQTGWTKPFFLATYTDCSSSIGSAYGRTGKIKHAQFEWTPYIVCNALLINFLIQYCCWLTYLDDKPIKLMML